MHPPAAENAREKAGAVGGTLTSVLPALSTPDARPGEKSQLSTKLPPAVEKTMSSMLTASVAMASMTPLV